MSIDDPNDVTTDPGRPRAMKKAQPPECFLDRNVCCGPPCMAFCRHEVDAKRDPTIYKCVVLEGLASPRQHVQEAGQARFCDTMSGDTFKRIKVSPDEYQCGCKWVRNPPNPYGATGDVLIECPIHRQAGRARFLKFERERKERENRG